MGLADKFCKEPFNMDVDTPQMLYLGLFSRFTGFKQHLIELGEVAMVTKVGEDYLPVRADEYELTFGNAEEVHLFTNIEGAGAEAIALISFTLEVSWATATVIYVAATIAVSMVLGAIIKALSPQPSAFENTQVSANASHIFNGPENVTRQGVAIPLIYGVHMAGSIVVSAAIETGDVAYAV